MYKRNRILIPLLLTGIVSLSCALPGVDNKTEESYVELRITESKPYATATPHNETLPQEETQSFYEPTDQVVTIQPTKRVVITNYFEVTVRRGDSLYRLAKEYCGDARQYKWLLQINGMAEGDLLRVGQAVKVNCR